MELMLVGVAAISLAIAVAMTLVAWTLIRNERRRSAARVEALAALAFTERADEAAVHEAPSAASAIDPQAVIAPRATAGQEWDLALGSQTARDRDDSVRDEMFDHPRATGVAARRWLAVAAVLLVAAASFTVLASLRKPEIVAAIAASRPGAGDGVPLELLSLRHSTDGDGHFTVTGLVQNPAQGRELDHVEAVVYLFDDGGRFFAKGQAALDVAAVVPGDESPFVVKVAASSAVGRYRVGFRRADGRAVTHVDRRGSLPAGTTGDTFDETELARPAGGMRPVDGASTR